MPFGISIIKHVPINKKEKLESARGTTNEQLNFN